MEKKIDLSFIVPVHNKAPFLKGYFQSILEQDIWERCEIIAVENGSTDDSWDELNKIVAKLSPKNREQIHLMQIDKANACIARNEGMKVSKGRYVSFLPADAALLPGIARNWVEALDEFPEYGFCYGGYKFGPPHGGVFMAEKFDVEMLKQYNYIDGSYPLKRELFPWWNNGGWDPDIKSLQDWDFWLAIVLGKDGKGTGVKGLYRPEICFETIPPQPGGLSEDSHNNWVERNHQIKGKYGIPESSICITSPGAPFHAKNLSKITGFDFRYAPQTKANEFKMIYEIGYYPQLAQQCSAVFSTVDGKIFPGKKVIHWVGSDVWGLLNSSILQVKNLKNQFDVNNFTHLVEFEQTQKELKELGIDARIVPLPPSKLYEPIPFPKGKFTVAVYMPEQNQGFYYPEIMKEVAHKLPEFNFLFFGNRYDLSKDKNIQNVGYVEEMDKLIAECHAIVRLTQHDGLPISLVEFVTAGRNALFNIKMPHMVFCNTSNTDAIAQRIKDMAKLPLNEEGSKYYRELMDHDKYRQTIEAISQEVDYNPKEYWENRAEIWNAQAAHGNYPHVEEVTEMLDGLNFKTVLDVGCGNGRWYPFFKENGKDYEGIDIAEKMVARAREAYPDGRFDAFKLEDINPEGPVYDLAFSYTCLQHIRPEDIEAAAAVLKKKSKYSLLIETPDNWGGNYGFNHEYKKYFNIVKEMKAKKAEDNPDSSLTLMLTKND